MSLTYINDQEVYTNNTFLDGTKIYIKAKPSGLVQKAPEELSIINDIISQP